MSTLTRTEWKLFFREPAQVFWGVAFPVCLLVVAGVASSSPSKDLGGLTFVQAWAPTLLALILGVLGVSALPPALATDREAGVLRRLGVTPVGAPRLLRAQVAIYATVAVVTGALILAVGRLAFDVALPGQAVGFVLAAALAIAALLAFGLLIGSLAPTPRTATAFGAMAFFPMMFFAGLWIPRPAMGHVLRSISDYTPLGATTHAFSTAMAGHWPPVTCYLALLAWAVLLSLAAARFFRWEPHRS